MPGLTLEDLEAIFTYHAPTLERVRQYEAIRATALVLAADIFHACPESAERTLAFRHIQQAVMFANAAIAIHEKVGTGR